MSSARKGAWQLERAYGRGGRQPEGSGCVCYSGCVHSKVGQVFGKGLESNSSASRSAGLLLFVRQRNVELHPQFFGIFCVIFCCHATMALIAITYGG